MKSSMMANIVHWRPVLNLASLQACIDALDEGHRFINPPWHEWADASDDAAKPSMQLL